MNLILDAWLPVRCRDGTTRTVRPADIVAPPDAPDAPMDLNTPRPDFRGALLEFLVGLVQTACPPATDDEWRDRLLTPPDAAWLHAQFEPLAPYFNLLEGKIRFQQDMGLKPTKKTVFRIEKLLIDAPGDNALKENRDFFVKRSNVENVCPNCAAMALLTMQSYAPGGGPGYFTSLRRGGPLVTIVKANSLWKTVSANTLPLSRTGKVKPQAKPSKIDGYIFPWCDQIESNTKERDILPTEKHFLTTFWSMPRRILLLLERDSLGTQCDICCRNIDVRISRYATRPYGNKYSNQWMHPFSPYRIQALEASSLSVLAEPESTGYHHWLGYIFGETISGEGKTLKPASCIDNARRILNVNIGSLSLGAIAYGYAMDKGKANKPLQWIEGDIPLISISSELADEFRNDVAKLIHAASIVRDNLISGAHRALYYIPSKKDRPGEIDEKVAKQLLKDKEDKKRTRLTSISTAFWTDTRSDFFDAVGRMAKDPTDEDEVLEAGDAFARSIQVQALRLFDRAALSGNVDVARMKRVLEARGKMENFNQAGLRTLGLLLKTEAKDAGTESVPQ